MKPRIDLTSIEIQCLALDRDTLLRLLRQASTRLACIRGTNECTELSHMIDIDIACRELFEMEVDV